MRFEKHGDMRGGKGVEGWGREEGRTRVEEEDKGRDEDEH